MDNFDIGNLCARVVDWMDSNQATVTIAVAGIIGGLVLTLIL